MEQTVWGQTQRQKREIKETIRETPCDEKFDFSLVKSCINDQLWPMTRKDPPTAERKKKNLIWWQFICLSIFM